MWVRKVTAAAELGDDRRLPMEPHRRPAPLHLALLAGACLLAACHRGSDPCQGLDVPPAHAGPMVRLAEQRTGTMVTAKHAIVATSHPLSARIAFAVLRKGGSAIDAYIAATLTDDLVMGGATSTAGLAGVLVYAAPTQASSAPGRHLAYIHGPLATVSAPSGLWREGDPAVGKQVLIPGEVAALEEAWLHYGKLKWEDDVLPVAALAREGFPIDEAFSKAIAARAQVLLASEYGRATFFRGGKPLQPGDRLQQPAYADTLEQLAKHGSGHLYRGDWAKAFVEKVRSKGGVVDLADLNAYRPDTSEPHHGFYRELDVATSSGLSFGGVKMLLSLETLDHFDLGKLGPREGSAKALELLIDVQRAVEDEHFYLDPDALADRKRMENVIAVAALNISRAVGEHEKARTPYQPRGGTHSAHVIVVDADGNIATGTHSMETAPWGEGLFVNGIPLATAAPFVTGPLKPGHKLIDPLSTEIVFQKGEPRLALGTYGSGLYPADVQVFSGLADYGLDPEQAVLEPRLGWFAVNPLSHHPDPTVNLLDPRVPQDVVCELLKRGVEVSQREESGAPKGMLDLGYPTVVKLNTGRLEAMTPELAQGAALGF